VQQETATRVKEACEHFNKASRDPSARKSSHLLKDFAGNHLVPGQGCCPFSHKTEQKSDSSLNWMQSQILML
jgi:hypothetical protein